MMKGVVLPGIEYLSGAAHIHRKTNVGTDGSVLIRTCKVADGKEYDVEYDYTPPLATSPINLLQFCRRESK